jgi:membrane-bound ClpP family serine protease
VAVYDDIIFKVVREAEADLEQRLDSDIVYFNSEIRMNIFPWFREVIEKLAQRLDKKASIAIFLTTPGGQAEVVEKLVEVVRAHYCLVHFVVPVAAMSAGTIFCMSGDKIYMDYSSSLGPARRGTSACSAFRVRSNQDVNWAMAPMPILLIKFSLNNLSAQLRM